MKTIKKVTIEPIFFDEFLPEKEDMIFGKLYISRAYHGCNHFCLCGCGHECYLPLAPDEWTLTENPDGTISITPSIQQRFACKSHYVITNNVANIL